MDGNDRAQCLDCLQWQWTGRNPHSAKGPAVAPPGLAIYLMAYSTCLANGAQRLVLVALRLRGEFPPLRITGPAPPALHRHRGKVNVDAVIGD